MDKAEIRNFVNDLGDDEWYYYFNFGGIEVKKKLKQDHSCGFHNWDKLMPIMGRTFNEIAGIPHVFDIGCNMALYAHEMTKMGSNVTAVDRDMVTAEFYAKYVQENLNEEWKVDLRKMDVTEGLTFMPEIDIVTMFCVIYHLNEHVDDVMVGLTKYFPNHRYLVLQGNTPRVKKKKQKIAGVEGMKKCLYRHGYETNSVHEWEDHSGPLKKWRGHYPKPVVVGERSIDA